MQEHDMAWVRTEMALAEAAPRSQVGVGAWVRLALADVAQEAFVQMDHRVGADLVRRVALDLGRRGA